MHFNGIKHRMLFAYLVSNSQKVDEGYTPLEPVEPG
jgi:hypothetical protein